MKIRVKNYRRFLAMTVLTAAALFLICWGIVFIIQNVIIENPVEVDETILVDTTSPRNPQSPYLLLVSPTSPIDVDYEPTDLVVADIPSDYYIYLSQETATQAQRLFEAAAADGIDLYAIKGYVDSADQAELNAEAIAQDGDIIGLENTTAGTSEHQSGLALDVSTGETNYELRQDFALTDAGKWLIENAENYGFIIRYPQGKESSTGNIYEPWHIRYVGLEDAQRITDNNLSLEEYLGISNVEDSTATD